jgi:hypothetical protein
MTDDALFDDPETLLAQESAARVVEAKTKFTRAEANEAQLERLRGLIAEGYIVKRGPQGGDGVRLWQR